MGNEQSSGNELTKIEKVPETHENGSANGLSVTITPSGLDVDVNGEAVVEKNGVPPSLDLATEVTETICDITETVPEPADAPVASETPEPVVQEVEVEVKKTKGEKSHRFGKLFKKKAPKAEAKTAEKEETSGEDQTDVSLPATDPEPEDTADVKQDSESAPEPETVTADPAPEQEEAPETDNADSPPVEEQEDVNPEEKTVMNFFKTLVTPTKTTKKGSAAPDATKEQSQQENQPAETTTAAQVSEPPAAPKGMSIPPPPPPEPPKVEIKGEPAAKPVKTTPKEEPKAAAKEAESKGKSAKDALSKFFRPKTIKDEPQPAVEVEVQPVIEVQETPVEEPEPVVEVQIVEEEPQPVVEEEKVDPSKTGTLEAAAKPEPPPPVQEEKKSASKSSFMSLFKNKVSLTSDPKKSSPAPAAAAEPAQTVKPKEEPKPAAKTSEPVVDNKPAAVASQAGDDAANVPKKLEKRNSIQLFFKILGQKRNSTDAGVQTEPVVAAPAAEKSK